MTKVEKGLTTVLCSTLLVSAYLFYSGWLHKQAYEEKQELYEQQQQWIRTYYGTDGQEGLTFLQQITETTRDYSSYFYEASQQVGVSIEEIEQEEGRKKWNISCSGNFYALLALWDKMEKDLPLHRVEVDSIQSNGTGLHTVFSVEFF